MAKPEMATLDASFVAETAQRSLPNPNRPRLRTETEAKLAEVDRKDAAKYASMETFTHQFNAVADALASDDADSVPEEVEAWQDDSMVHHIEETRAKLIG